MPDRHPEEQLYGPVPANVTKTLIYTDDRGRRRRADDQVERFPGNKDDTTAAIMAKVAALTAALTAYKILNDARTITGGGSAFSGNFGSGLIYNPNAAGASDTGDNEPGSDDPAFIVPAGTGVSPETTTWHRDAPPDGYNGVQVVSIVRTFVDYDNPVSTTTVTTPTGTVTITVCVCYIFVRPVTFDSLGGFTAVGAEDRIDPTLCPTVTTVG